MPHCGIPVASVFHEGVACYDENDAVNLKDS